VRLLDSVITLQLPSPVHEAVAKVFPLTDELPAKPTATVTVEEPALRVTSGGNAFQADSFEHALLLVATLVNGISLAQCTSLAFHAGAVAVNGAVTAFAAESGRGKSTLTAALLQQGWDYVSDEALVIEGTTGAVRPYPKPLSLHTWTLGRLSLAPPSAGLDERLVSPRELSAAAASTCLELRHLVILRRGDSSCLVPQPRPAGAAHLLGHSFNHYRDPTASFRLTSRVTERVDCWTLTVSDPVDAASLLTRALS
jgi:hypothetical protein